MFITVKYGDSEEVLFNPNCKIQILLEDLKRRCKRQKEEEVDLSDESGNLKNLRDHRNEYATVLLKARERFVLIKVEKKDGEDSPSYTPLLNDMDLINTAFMQRLSRPGSGDSSSRSASRQRKKSTSSWNKMRAGVILSGGVKGRSGKSKGSRSDKRGSHSRDSDSRLANLTV